MQFYNEFKETRETCNRLPHKQQEGGTLFVAYRLDDSIPVGLMEEWSEERAKWIAQHPKPWDEETDSEYHRKFTYELELLMDKGYGSCVLREAKIRAIVEESFQNFEGIRYDMHSCVVMPNHVHVMFSLKEGTKMEKVLASWKNYTATRINGALGQEGALWQKDYFDRMIRDWDHFAKVSRYIRKNPLKAKLREGEFSIYEDEIVKRVLR